MFEDKVYGITVRSAKSNYSPVANFSDSNQTATLDKLTQNKITISDIKAGRIGFYNKVDSELKTYITHWKNVVIKDDENDQGDVDQVITRKGAD